MDKFNALVIDDNAKNLEVLAKLLSMQGGACIEISHPKELETQWADLPALNVVFVDLEMPRLDGYEVLQLFKADERFQATPIIAYTVHVSERKAAYEQGFDGFLGKPINGAKFPDQLARILNGDAVWETVS